MALSARDWEVVMRTPLFKAMGPAIARAMINDRAPQHIRARRNDLRGGRSGRRVLLHDRRLGEALSPSRGWRGDRRVDLLRRRDLRRGRDVPRRPLSGELRGGVAGAHPEDRRDEAAPGRARSAATGVRHAGRRLRAAEATGGRDRAAEGAVRAAAHRRLFRQADPFSLGPGAHRAAL